jgi:cytochrome c556
MSEITHGKIGSTGEAKDILQLPNDPANNYAANQYWKLHNEFLKAEKFKDDVEEILDRLEPKLENVEAQLRLLLGMPVDPRTEPNPADENPASS